MGVLVGAYPLLDGRSASQQSELYAKLSEVPHVSGLELPWSGSIHPLGEQWLASLMPDRWNVVITTIPGTVSALNTDPAFGLASLSKDGSEAAVAELVRVRDGARRLNDAAGARVVSGVELHSAPARGRSSAASLAASLARVASWDWDGAELLLEHVDAQMDGHESAKGFLDLDVELGLLQSGQLPVGILINWARSAIELRDADRVHEHLVAAREAGVLRALVFSGVSDRRTPYGAAWSDQHLPFCGTDGLTEPDSLLTEARAAHAILSAEGGVALGLKMSWRGRADMAAAMLVSAVERLAALDAIRYVAR